MLMLITVLNTLTDPVTNLRIENVHELSAHITTISFFERGDQLTQRHLLPAAVELGRNLSVQIGFTEPKLIELQARIRHALFIKRIKVGLGVTEGAVVIKQTYYPASEV